LIPIAKAQQGSASRFYIRARDTADMIFTETEDAQAMAQAWRECHE
jgi:hypothetical protein